MKAAAYRKLIGYRVQTLREAQKWSQTRLAEYAGCGQSQISRLEDGDAPLDHDVMLSIADALEVSVLRLLPPLKRQDEAESTTPDLAATLYALYADMDAGTVRSIAKIADALYRDDLRDRLNSDRTQTHASAGTSGSTSTPGAEPKAS